MEENEFSETYSTSVVKSILAAWATNNSLLVIANDKVRLITDAELTNNLKYKLNGVANVVYVSEYETGNIN